MGQDDERRGGSLIVMKCAHLLHILMVFTTLLATNPARADETATRLAEPAPQVVVVPTAPWQQPDLSPRTVNVRSFGAPTNTNWYRTQHHSSNEATAVLVGVGVLALVALVVAAGFGVAGLNQMRMVF